MSSQKPRASMVILAMMIILSSIGFLLLVWTRPMRILNQAQYWRGNVTQQQDAPDGWYEVLPYKIEGSFVLFPMCESCGSHLHGSWEFMGNVTWGRMDEWYHVRLVDNVIVEADHVIKLTCGLKS